MAYGNMSLKRAMFSVVGQHERLRIFGSSRAAGARCWNTKHRTPKSSQPPEWTVDVYDARTAQALDEPLIPCSAWLHANLGQGDSSKTL